MRAAQAAAARASRAKRVKVLVLLMWCGSIQLDGHLGAQDPMLGHPHRPHAALPSSRSKRTCLRGLGQPTRPDEGRRSGRLRNRRPYPQSRLSWRLRAARGWCDPVRRDGNRQASLHRFGGGGNAGGSRDRFLVSYLGLPRTGFGSGRIAGAHALAMCGARGGGRAALLVPERAEVGLYGRPVPWPWPRRAR